MQLHNTIETAIWMRVPEEVTRLVKLAAPAYQVMQWLVEDLPDIGATTWYDPDAKKVLFHYPLDTDSNKVASWHIAMKQVPDVDIVEHGPDIFLPEQDPYMLIKKAEEPGDIFGPVASAMQLKPNSLNRLWGGPNPLAATIGGGLLGAGAGYGLGWLGEKLLPDEYFAKGKLRRAGGLIGGLVGAAPGAMWGLNNFVNGPPEMSGLHRLVSGYPMREEDKSGHATPDLPPEPNIYRGAFDKTSAFEALQLALDPEFKELNELWIKYADELSDSGLGLDLPIPVDRFNRVVWNDLSTAGGSTPPQIAAATTGVVQAASLSQGGVNWITPMDVARIGLGAGSGYTSGLLVGKTLGVLAGLRPEAQKSLQQAGVWAGVLSNVLPKLFGS